MLRMLRLARVARVLRVVKIPFFREMKLLMSGIAGLVKTLSSALMLLLLLVYFLGVILAQVMNDIDEPSDAHKKGEMFTSFPRSMFTVFRCFIVGDCSAEDGTPITLYLMDAIGWPYPLFYCIFS